MITSNKRNLLLVVAFTLLGIVFVSNANQLVVRKEAELNKIQQEQEELQEEQEQLLEEKDKLLKDKNELENKNKELDEKLQAKLEREKSQTVRVASATNMTEEQAMNWIISKEGGPTSVNKSSLACGMPQALPCSKLLKYARVDMSKYNLNTYAGVKAAISTVPGEVQRSWMKLYISQRYGTALKARQFWLANNWY